MIAVIKLHDVKAAAVYIEVDVLFFKIRSYGFPERYLGMKLFKLAPGCIADAFYCGLLEKQRAGLNRPVRLQNI